MRAKAGLFRALSPKWPIYRDCRKMGFRGGDLLGLHTDARAAFMGAKLNPMISMALDEVLTNEQELLTRLAVLAGRRA